MEKNFEQILELCKTGQVNIRADSRLVEKGDIFVALPGDAVNGTAFIEDAVKKGATTIICADGTGYSTPDGTQIVYCADPHKALVELARARYGTKNHAFKIIGITGTNGKTTCAYLLEHLYQQGGNKTGVFGTVTWRWPGHEEKARLTTPDVLEIHSKLHEMQKAGCDDVIMEISSHALAKKRIDGLDIDGAIFTNLTQDHLDYHKTMENYFRAKAKLFFEQPRSDKKMAINSDDKWGRRLLELLPDALAFGLHHYIPGRRQLFGEIIRHDARGISLRMRLGKKTWEIHSSLIGNFNAQNLLAVQALALEMGLNPDDLASLENFHGVCGRMERIINPQGLHVFVDYAHTPDALANVLATLKEAGFKRIVAVFGCGGNRDKGKRPLMGEVVGRMADIAILTSDNPRDEEPEDIIKDVLPGLAGASQLVVEPDRRQATKKALELLEKNDALLIAGKGHEDYQIIKGVKHHYSDQETVREFLNCA